MGFWKSVIDLGHTELMFPLAAAVAACLLVGRAWKLALCWCVLFVTGTSVVALSKIAFLGWGVGIPALTFKALSGHAYCATTVLPVILMTMLHKAPVRWRLAALACGWLASAGIGWLMVHFAYHSVSEVLGGFLLGAGMSAAYLRISISLPALHWSRTVAVVGMLVFVILFSLKPALVNHKIVALALQLSGRGQSPVWPKKSPNTVLCKMQLPSPRQALSRAEADGADQVRQQLRQQMRQQMRSSPWLDAPHPVSCCHRASMCDAIAACDCKKREHDDFQVEAE